MGLTVTKIVFAWCVMSAATISAFGCPSVLASCTRSSLTACTILSHLQGRKNIWEGMSLVIAAVCLSMQVGCIMGKAYPWHWIQHSIRSTIKASLHLLPHDIVTEDTVIQQHPLTLLKPKPCVHCHCICARPRAVMQARHANQHTRTQYSSTFRHQRRAAPC